MGIFRRVKGAIKTKANAVVDKAVDPARELEMVILELDEQRKKAIAELLSYKATSKQLEQDLERYQRKIAEWEKRAMLAVQQGNDELAKQALREKQRCVQELERIQRDRNEAAGYAVELNKSRKEAEVKLRMLKLKKGTMATQLRAARSGGNAFGHSDELWDKLERAEERIEVASAGAEVEAALESSGISSADFDRQLAAAGGDEVEDDALTALKSKMGIEQSGRGSGRNGGET